MVKKQKKRSTKSGVCKGFDAKPAEPRQIKASTSYGTCTEQLSPFGGLLALVFSRALSKIIINKCQPPLYLH